MKGIDRFKTKQFGVLLIIIGIFIPSILYPFTIPTTNTNMRNLKIVLVEAKYKAAPKNVITSEELFGDRKGVITSEELFGDRKGVIMPLKDVVFDDQIVSKPDPADTFRSAITIPYKYPVAIGILFVFIGGCLVVFGKKGNVIYL
ncbi:MAG: hypothetical protein KKD69_06485 [Euryarchaeota archaeon]|nr:hypothetical protein [Euryarchaeota archaeon]